MKLKVAGTEPPADQLAVASYGAYTECLPGRRILMRKLICLVGVLATVGFASVAAAGELSVKIANGRATVIAKDVPIRQILAEWGRVGETKMVHIEKMVGGPVTLELIDVPEKEALDILLRTAAGYMAAPRPANQVGASQFDRVIVLATSRPPASTASMPPPPFGRPGVQTIMQPPPDDDDGEPGDQGMPPPVMGPNGPVQQVPGPMIGPNGQIIGPNGVITGPNGQPLGPNSPMGPNGMPAQPATTAPRPGMIPQPQPGTFPPNPYTPAGRPGQGRPGGQEPDK
jgi:hypothetical protein